MSSKHTSGQWSTDDAGFITAESRGGDSPPSRRIDTPIAAIIDENGLQVMDAQDLSEEQYANARLMAAAPDMLAALEVCVDAFVDYHGHHEPEACPVGKGGDGCEYCIARAAIAKATGQPAHTD